MQVRGRVSGVAETLCEAHAAGAGKRRGRNAHADSELLVQVGADDGLDYAVLGDEDLEDLQQRAGGQQGARRVG